LVKVRVFNSIVSSGHKQQSLNSFAQKTVRYSPNYAYNPQSDAAGQDACFTSNIKRRVTRPRFIDATVIYNIARYNFIQIRIH